ncbi:TPM domain-containing protein [Camelimonas abortus]|uniref:TPM domain-containing protein n=1 Tax=Camelimonas abortus TaxID=1017184 RepID=A0ABV7LCF1_9HYPH
MLDEAGRRRVAEAIRAAEARTTGEIVCIVAREASSYRSWAIFLAAAVGFAAPGFLIVFTSWGPAPVWMAQLAAAALAGGALLWRPLRLALTPQFLKRERACEAARRQFAARGLQATAGRTGVLVFVAVSERHVEVIPDEGVAALAGEAAWRAAVEDLVTAIRAGRVAEGMEQVVTRIGAILAEHFPAAPGETRNELPDHVIML